MYKPVIEIEHILTREIDLYNEVFSLEQEKENAILSHDGKLLDSLAHQQETLLSEVNMLEDKREHLIEDYVKVNNLEDCGRAVTLREIIHLMDEDSSYHLLRMGMDLKALLLKLNELQMSNHVMMSDNMEFYNILVSGLKDNSSIHAGYSSDGKEQNMGSQSVFFNQTF